MKRLLFLLLFCSQLWATTYYISPSGSDANAGTSSGAPFKTFGHAIPLLFPGDSLTLVNGTYQPGTGTGFPYINCSSGAHNGTSGSPITIQAQNERQAHISGDGSAEPFQMHSCSFWNVFGLYVSDLDFATQHENDGTFAFYNSSHLQVRRNLVSHSNRCFNNHLIPLLSITQSVFEDNEMYFFHRWGIVDGSGSGTNEFRRNYANPRGAFGATNATCATYGNGPAAIGPYHGTNDIFENNISENPSNTDAGNHEGFDNEAEASSNTYLGNITLKMRFIMAAHQESPQPNANSYSNDVSIDPPTAGFWFRGGTNTTVNHSSIFGPGATAIMGFGLNPGLGSNSPTGYTGGFGMTVNNSQVQNLTGGGDGAYFVANNLSGSGTITFGFSHDNNFNNSVSYNPNTNVTSPLSLNPGYGACYLWAPDASPLKHAASDGGDVGATVLYQYVSGTLTSNKLWDGTTGAPLFKGATVAGVNDVAGDSLFDIANRLNINQNGCSFPSSYAGSVSSPNPPTGLAATVQ